MSGFFVNYICKIRSEYKSYHADYRRDIQSECKYLSSIIHELKFNASHGNVELLSRLLDDPPLTYSFKYMTPDGYSCCKNINNIIFLMKRNIFLLPSDEQLCDSYVKDIEIQKLTLLKDTDALFLPWNRRRKISNEMEEEESNGDHDDYGYSAETLTSDRIDNSPEKEDCVSP